MRQLRMMWGTWRPDDRWVLRGVAVAIVLACSIETCRVLLEGAGRGPATAIAITLFALVLSPWAPWVALVIASVAPVLGGMAGWEPVVSWSGAVLLVFAVCSRKGRPFLASGIVAPGTAVGTFLAPGSGGAVPTVLGALISVVAAAAIGAGIRIQHQYRASLEQRAADAVATREIEAERRVADERVRIARDLHDVLGHEIAVVSMQLGVAEVSLPHDAEPARSALYAARVGVRSILTETQHILTVLRSSAQEEGAAGAPAPEAAQLPGLIASYRRIGLDIDAHLDDLGSLCVPISVTLYRVLQESLTNVHRHGIGHASVVLKRADSVVILQVRNSRPLTTTSDRAGGFGIVGMRERVAAVGGEFRAEFDGREFVVSVHLPIADGAT